MGNSLATTAGGEKKAKVMKIDGEIFKLKTPIKVCELIKDYPDHVVLESNTFKRCGIRANPLDPEENLEGGKIYFLVELPKLPETTEKKERQEVVSEIPVVRAESGGGSVRVKVRLPKGEVDKLIGESRDEVELAERIVDFYVKKKRVTTACGSAGRR